MHALVVRVRITGDEQNANEVLRNEVVPRVSQSPGFVAGYWTRAGDTGLSMAVFDSEDQARQVSERVRQMAPQDVTVDDVEVREVVAHA
jgi:hypothetical protein